jgi:prepilin-type N-terminal cleavage/methylation domain-containing protein
MQTRGARIQNHAGFSLIEVLVATAILAAAIGALAQLPIIAVRANAEARTATVTTLLAAQKMEQLRGLAWGIDALGLPVSDVSTDLTSSPPLAGAGVGLTPSPSDALQRNTPGYCDFLDANGRSLGGGLPPPGAFYVRRWSIDALPSSPDALVLQVLVAKIGIAASTTERGPGKARLVTLKTRTSW